MLWSFSIVFFVSTTLLNARSCVKLSKILIDGMHRGHTHTQLPMRMNSENGSNADANATRRAYHRITHRYRCQRCSIISNKDWVFFSQHIFCFLFRFYGNWIGRNESAANRLNVLLIENIKKKHQPTPHHAQFNAKRKPTAINARSHEI